MNKLVQIIIRMQKQIKKSNIDKKGAQSGQIRESEKGLKTDSLQRFHNSRRQMEDQLQQCDQFEFEFMNNDQVIQQKTSFVSNMTERKRIQKKKKIVDYLQEQRNSLPTHRESKNYEQFILDQDSDYKNGNLENQLEIIQHTQIKNRIFQKFILQFNKNAQKAIDKYVANNIIKDGQPSSIANYLLKVEGINKAALGEYFGKNNPRAMQILHAYCDILSFQNVQFDIALRKLLSKFRLPGEAQQIQRIVWEFSLSYYHQNKDEYQNAEELFPLAYSIIMLATDAHNPKQQKKMTSEEFIKNTQRACPSIGKEYLQKIYQRIVKQKLQTQKNVYDKLPDFYLTNIKQALEFAEQLKKGNIIWKIVLNDKKFFSFLRSSKQCQFYKRKLFLSQDGLRICWIDPSSQKQQPRFIEIKDITDLTVGIASHLQTKKNIPKQCDVEFFTITTPLRTLDIRTETSKVRSKWLNYLRAVMIQKRQNKIQLLQRQYSAVLRRQNLEEIWNSDIFPHLDRHWDYQLKKPRQKGFFKQKVQKFCYCFTRPADNQNSLVLGMPLKNTLLETVWSYGLPSSIRKTLWDEIIGNSLQLNQLMIDDIKKRSIYSIKLRQIQQEPEVIETAQFVITLRPDLPHVKDLLQTSKVFHQVFTNQKSRLISLTNLIYKFHFLPFYKGDRQEIQLRTKLFEFLLEKNAHFVKLHFDAIKLQTKFYLVPWFLSIFSGLFKGQFMLRIWDNFLLEGQIYLFKVGISLIKYFQIELKMCTFYEGLKLLKFTNVQKSSILFFQILDKKIDVKQQHYYEYISRRKHAMIKTKIQSIQLE